MIVNTQNPIRFNNTCGCLVDYTILQGAILWRQEKPTASSKKIFMFGHYPAVSIHGKKFHVHRLIMSYQVNRILLRCEYVHHKDGNKLNAIVSNLEIQSSALHQSITNKGRKQTLTHVIRRVNAMSLTRYGHTIYETPNLIK